MSGKNQTKETPQSSGVYQIRCKSNGKIYIGSAVNFAIQCADREIGFNIYPVAGSPGDTFVQVWEGFIDPQGNEVTIINLERFCQEQGLNRSSMSRMARGKGKLKSYKGWAHKNSIRQLKNGQRNSHKGWTWGGEQ